MSDIKDLQKKIIKFRNDRDWKQFHNPKDLAIDLSLEASEVLEHFLWKSKEEQTNHIKRHKEEVADELADVLMPLLILAYDFNIDIKRAFEKKLKKTAKKYPVSKVKGKHLKYTEYE
jgi:dCTP diphosphatase